MTINVLFQTDEENDMNRLLTTFLTALLILSSCVFSTGGKVDQMDEQSFVQLTKNVEDTAFISGFILKDKMKPSTREVLVLVTDQLAEAFSNGSVSLPDSLNALVDQYALALAKNGIDQNELELIKATIRLVDSAFGGVRVGIDGIGSTRSQQLMAAVLRGLERGLQ